MTPRRKQERILAFVGHHIHFALILTWKLLFYLTSKIEYIQGEDDGVEDQLQRMNVTNSQVEYEVQARQVI